MWAIMSYRAFISTFMPINKKPNGKSYLGHKNSKQAGVWPLLQSGGHVCVFCALLKFILSESQNKHGQGAIVSASAETRALVVTYENRNKPRARAAISLAEHEWRGAHINHSQRLAFPPPLRAIHERAPRRGVGWRMKSCGSFCFTFSQEEVNSLYLGAFFFFLFHFRNTHTRSVWQSVTPCLFLNHILFCSRSQLWQTSNRRADVNFLVIQHDTEASCLPECD